MRKALFIGTRHYLEYEKVIPLIFNKIKPTK